MIFSFSNIYSQGRDRSKYLAIIDTSGGLIDTSKSIDTSLTKIPIDSTARIKYFKYIRKDQPNPLFGQITIPFFLSKSNEVQYKVEFDSSNQVIIREQVNNQDIKYPIILPFEKYIKTRSELALRDQFYSIVSEKYKIESQDELEKLFKNITDITIPLPFATETIFGPPTVNIHINGQINITASYQKTSTDQQTITTTDQTQNNINFQQEVQVTAKGSIGDKLTIDADWNSQRTFEYENQLRLKYQGYPDEVIQKIEAGNVSLETKSNLIGSTAALFGIKGQFQLGPLTLTAIASQKKSEKKEVDITGGSQETPFEIPAYQYADNHFFLDTTYRRLYELFYSIGNVPNDSIQVSDIEVWIQTTQNNPNKRLAVVWTNLKSKAPIVQYDSIWRSQAPPNAQEDGYKAVGYYVKLNPGDFTLQSQAGYVSINVSMPQAPNDGVAVAYRLLRPRNGQIVQYGTYANEVGKDSLVLMCVHYPGLQSPDAKPSHRYAWEKKIKSIYSLTVRNIKNDPSKFDFKVYYKPPSGEVQYSFGTNNYLKLVKLDLRQNGGNFTDTTKTDGNFDFYPGYTIDLNAGEVIFPTLSPFYQTLRRQNVPDSLILIDSTIYQNSKLTAQNSTIKYYMGGKAIGDVSSRYSLGFNIVEGSVKVFNGSVQLVEGADYTIDYSTGELVIRNNAVLSAGANIKIQYESNDLFSLASKTLIGTRLEYNLNKNSYIGFSLINLKQQTLNDKVRIGEEPTNNTILGFDGSTQLKTNFISRLMNKIPGYNSKEESTLDLRGEVAFMLPEPNTKKSMIPSDNGESIAYIDDFEGAKKIISLGLNPLSWIVSSIPADTIDYLHLDSVATITNLYRSHLEWYNLLNDVNIHDVYPNRQVGSSQSQTLTPLVFKVDPTTPGMYTFIDQAHFNSLGPPQKKWSGVYKYLNISTTNLVDENIGFVEIWMKLYNVLPSDSAKMLIDLGVMSEKIIGTKAVPFNSPGKNFHTEDINGTGVLDPLNDLGIDGLTDAQEDAVAQALGYTQNITGDAARDNFNWQNGDTSYAQFNGTQGNQALSEGRRPDTEDLNGNGVLDEVNNYYEYALPLDTVISHNKYITGGNPSQGWYQYRIPLNEFYKAVNQASLTNVQYVRVWFKGLSQTALIKIVDFNLVGNQWQKANKNDSSYSISVVNIEENPDIYQPPVPGNVLRQTDQTSVDPNVLLNEQSISVDVRNLVQGQAKFAAKFFNTKPFDLLNYKILKLFVNGDPKFKYSDTSNYDADLIVRLGSDSANFYEYKAPVHPDVRPGTPWNPLNEVSINLTDLTQVKQLRDSVNILKYFPVPNGPPGAKYGVIGNPTLSSLTLMAIGVQNHHNNIIAYPITGSVWFDEMRVLKTDNSSGYAYNFSAALKVTDIGTFNFSFAKVSPNFHSLEERFGSRDQSNNWELSGTLNLHKIINSLLASAFSVKLKDFITFPLTFSHSESYDLPTFLPGTDIDLQKAIQNKYNAIYEQTHNAELATYYSNQVKIAAQNLRVTNRIAVNGFKFTLPNDNFFVQELLNKIELNYYWNGTKERSPVSESKYTWDMGGSIGMTSNLKLMNTINLSLGKLIPLGDEYKNAKLYFFFPFMPLMPFFTSTLSLGANYVRNRGDEVLRNQGIPSPTTRAFTANRNFALDWKFIENWIIDLTGSYTFGAGSDLTYLETTNDSLKQQRSNKEIYHDIFFNDGLINFGKDLSYNQVMNINPKFNIPGLKKFLDLTASYRVQYGWAPTQTYVQGSTVGYSADLQTTGYFKLNQIFDLFKSSGTEKKPGGGSGFYQNNDQNVGEILKLLKGFIPDQLTLTYSQNKTLANGGVQGRPGFANFWVLLSPKENYGPSRLYQLGWGNYPGKRVPNILGLQDREGYSNSINLSTFITPIFPNNLKISLTYKSSWGNANQLNYNTDSLGVLSSPTSILNLRTTSKPTFLFGTNNTTMISKLAKPTNVDPNANAKEISDSFEKSVIAFPFPSWDITLNGIEKFDLFAKFATSITFENSFSSDFKRSLRYNGIQPEYVESEGVTSGFSPLIGINIAFKPLEGGTLTASFKYNKTNNYDLSPTSGVINNNNTSDFAINASFTKSGFKIPLFGLSLDNDISVLFTYTKTTNDPRTLTYHQDEQSWTDDALNGSISTTLNPSIQYALSKSVSIQVFYKYTVIGPTEGSVQIPTRKSNEAGLNLRLSIQ